MNIGFKLQNSLGEGDNLSGVHMISLIIIWLIFAYLFIVLGVTHLFASKKAIGNFQAQEIRYREDIHVEFVGPRTDVDLNEPLRDFVQNFNSYINEVNKSSRNGNRLAALGYFLATATAFLSMLIEMKAF